MELKSRLQDYTESEFQLFVEKIWNVDVHKEDHDRLINHFDQIVGHPQGADLLFYPEDTLDVNSPGAVVYHVKQWHFKQNIIPFKGGVLPAPIQPAPKLSTAERATARAKEALANTRKLAAQIDAAERVVAAAFDRLERAIQQPPPEAASERVKEDIRQLEQAQHEVLMAVGAFERWKMSVEFGKSAAQSNLTYSRSDQDLWQANVQQATANHGGYLAHLATIVQRHADLHSKAEAILERAWVQLVRLREQHADTVLFRIPVLNGIGRSDLLLSDARSLVPSQRRALQGAIRSVIAEFNWTLTGPAQENAGQYGGVLNFNFISRAKEVRFGLCVALSEIYQAEHDWQALAAYRGEVELPLRMSTRTTTALDGRLFRGLKEIRRLFQIYITPRAGLTSGKVRVRPAIWQQDRKGFRLTTDGPRPSAIDWTLPRGFDACVESAKSILDSAGFIRSPLVPLLESFDPVEPVQFDDYVVVFPQDSGLDPVYVLLNDRRDCPGVVKGLGQVVSSDWRTQAGSNHGAPIPTQIADQLRGQVFERFDAFQRAFWKTVATTPTLNAQFNTDNRALMLSGAAPLSEQTEGNHALRILHRVDVMQGADVYDLDNMKICL